jgi:hypothetical protein
MNIALLVKWIWKLHNESAQDTLWHRIIRAKYPGAADIFGSSAQGGSPFWQSLHKIKHYFKLGAKYLVGNGSTVRFWTDMWTGDAPLCSRYVRLFQILADPQGLISQMLREGRWNIRFRRSFGREEQESWVTLLQEISETRISDSMDSVSWNLEPSGSSPLDPFTRE